MIWLIVVTLLFYPLVVLIVAITGPHSAAERAALEARGLEIREKKDD